jgi:hypothetical protein
MKKALFLILMLFSLTAFSQEILTVELANGAVGVDSISGNTTTYFYAFGTTATQNSISTAHGLKATKPITQYKINSYMAGTAHSLVTASDSTAISWEVSYDNTNWFALTGTYPSQAVGTGGGANTLHVYTTYALLRYAQWIPTVKPLFPYVRCKMVNSTTGRKYPKAYLILEKI